MTTGTLRLELEPRTVLGKKVALLRQSGIIPIHLYGPGVESRALQCQAQTLIQVLSLAGGNTPVTVTVRGEPGSHLAFVREIQWDPKRDDLVHVDLLVAQANRPVSALVPVVLTGESPGARSSRGTVIHLLRELAVEALPLEMPSQVEVDLGSLTDPNEVIRAGDIVFPSRVTLLTDPDAVVVRIELPRVAVEAAPEEAAEAEEAPGEEGGEPRRRASTDGDPR
ncbi:MAG: 50S ribosomal protein L25 [Chloroflexota bacterium]